MNLLTRLLVVTVLIFAGVGAMFWFTYRAARQNAGDLLRDLTEQHLQHFDSAKKLQGAVLESLVSSYAWWDEMVKFMAKPDAKWATDNINNLVGIPNGGDALWVLDPDLNTIHVIDEFYGQPRLPVDDPGQLRQLIGKNYTFQFFAVIKGELWQIFGAAIQDASFWRNETPVRGYLLIGKKWSDVWQARLGSLANARITLRTTRLDEPGPSLPPTVRGFAQPVTGLNGEVIAMLNGRFNLDLFNEFDAAYNRQLLFLGIWVVATLVAIGVFVAFIILRPLGKILRSLETKNPLPIADLLSARTEFGEIARLLASQIRRDRMLQDEIRRHHENMSPEQRQRDTETNEALRLRLAGNLHDGPVQSLYAAGLQLTSIEADVAAGKSIAADRIAASKAILAQATADLRNLLLDLEPEELRDRDLESALNRIENRMRTIGRCAFRLAVAEGALDAISRDAQLHLFYICRELASNAIRHARPTRAALEISAHSGFLRIDWENDGVESIQPPGKGLRSIEHRTEELGGTCRLESGGGNWRVSIELPYTSLAASQNS